MTIILKTEYLNLIYIHQYTSTVHRYNALVAQSSICKQRFPTIEDSSFVSTIWLQNKRVCQHSAKSQYLSQYFSRQIFAVTFLGLGVWQWCNMAQISYNENVSFHMQFCIFGYVRVEWFCWTQTYMYQCSLYCNITNSTVFTSTLRM